MYPPPKSLRDMFDALCEYQSQADADGHGESWRKACEEPSVATLDAAIEDAGEKMIAADPDWRVFDGNGGFNKRKPNDDYDRMYRAGEAMCSARWAFTASTEEERNKNINGAINIISSLTNDEEDYE
jgi:hypothetical protein